MGLDPGAGGLTIQSQVTELDVASPDQGDAARLRESVEAGLELGDGDLVLLGEKEETSYSTLRSCPREIPLRPSRNIDPTGTTNPTQTGICSMAAISL